MRAAAILVLTVATGCGEPASTERTSGTGGNAKTNASEPASSDPETTSTETSGTNASSASAPIGYWEGVQLQSISVYLELTEAGKRLVTKTGKSNGDEAYVLTGESDYEASEASTGVFNMDLSPLKVELKIVGSALL